MTILIAVIVGVVVGVLATIITAWLVVIQSEAYPPPTDEPWRAGESRICRS